MRSTQRWRALVVALVTGCGLAVPGSAIAAATETCPTADACVFVHTSSGVQVVSGEQVNDWANQAVGTPNGVSDVNYQERFSSGADPQSVFVGLGLSINALLANLGIDPSIVFTEMPRSDGSLADLTSSELSIPTSFQGPDLPSLWINGIQQLFFIRPLRSDSDVNVTDDGIQTSQGGVLDLYLYTGAMLELNANVPTQGKVKQPLTFSATSSPTAGGETPTFTWTFSDGTTAQGQQVRHMFAKAGADTAYVTAAGIGGDDSFGALDEPLFINITDSTRSPSPPPTKSPGGGQSSPPTSPKPGPQSSHGTQPTGPPTSSATPSVTGSASGRPARGVTLPTTGLSGTRAAAESAQPPVIATLDNQLPLVRGQLLGQGAVVLSGPPPGAASAGVAPFGRLSSGRRDLALAGSIAAIMLLLAAGAARELRWFGKLRSVVRPR
ncbi:MAG TPA: PKD domain-containing protein [Mycobacteriales bacterium]|nr:PKD domain-containing protein [Mycobacteriales bacterium]